MGSTIVTLYILIIFFKYGAHLYTKALQFITRSFNPSYRKKKIQRTRYGNRVILQVFTN